MDVSQSLYIRTARCQQTERFPVWMMRQAGRYMSAYQQIRQKHSLMQMFRNPDIVAEVTLQPIRAFGMDAAILFSDILVVPDALGLGLSFVDNQGPCFAKPIQSMDDVQSLEPEKILEKLDYVMQGIALTKKGLEAYAPITPLIGFAGAPFTVASYIVGNGKGHSLPEFMKIMLSAPEMIHALLHKIAEATILYVNKQIEAGVDAIQFFDSWTNVLSLTFFKELALPYLKKVIAAIHNPKKIPIAVFGLANSVFYPFLQESGATVIGFDSHADMRVMRQAITPAIAIQGNLDPHLLYAPRKVLEDTVLSMLISMRNSRGFIFNLGHGIFPDIQEDQIRCVVDLVKEHIPLADNA